MYNHHSKVCAKSMKCFFKRTELFLQKNYRRGNYKNKIVFRLFFIFNQEKQNKNNSFNIELSNTR